MKHVSCGETIEAGSHLSSVLRRRERFAGAVGRVRTKLTLQENLLAAGVAPHPERGQVHCEVVPRLLRVKLMEK